MFNSNKVSFLDIFTRKEIIAYYETHECVGLFNCAVCKKYWEFMGPELDPMAYDAEMAESEG